MTVRARVLLYAAGSVLLAGVIGCGAGGATDDAPVPAAAGGLLPSATAAPSAVPSPTPSPTPATIEDQVVAKLRAYGAQSATCGAADVEHVRTCTVTYSGGTTATMLVTGERTVTAVVTSPAAPPPVLAPPTEDPGSGGGDSGNDGGGNTGGATAVCKDGTLSYSQHRSGTCSHHGGVAKWL